MFGVPKVSDLIYEPKPGPFLKALKKPPPPQQAPKKETKHIVIAQHTAENCDISIVLEEYQLGKQYH